MSATFPGVSRAARACMAAASEYFDAVNWFRAVHLGNGRGQRSGTPPTLELGGDVLSSGLRGEPPRRGSVLLSSLAGRRLGVNSCVFSFWTVVRQRFHSGNHLCVASAASMNGSWNPLELIGLSRGALLEAWSFWKTYTSFPLAQPRWSIEAVLLGRSLRDTLARKQTR